MEQQQAAWCKPCVIAGPGQGSSSDSGVSHWHCKVLVIHSSQEAHLSRAFQALLPVKLLGP
jgi:hypothetical protein